MSPDDSDQALQNVYDGIYLHHTDVWDDQGRSDLFRTYLAGLVRETPHDRVLEIGCGEGALLSRLPGKTKHGIDPSFHALIRARQRSGAECAVARCEQLPFPANSFDVIVAVGVMEHFEFIDASLQEISRSLAPKGRYVALIQTDMTRGQRVAHKVAQYIAPRFRPWALVKYLAKWIRKSTLHPIVQPLRKSYSRESAVACLERNDLRVIRTLDQRNTPSAPLDGPHVLILIAEKSAG